MTIIFVTNQLDRLPLSVVIIALNEEQNIVRAITSASSWISEVLVYDSGSTDKTVDALMKLDLSAGVDVELKS